MNDLSPPDAIGIIVLSDTETDAADVPIHRLDSEEVRESSIQKDVGFE